MEQVKKGVQFGDVGYQRPPKEHQFKKGQSGNPKGRPKMSAINGAGDLDALVLKEAERTVTVRDGDDVKKISAIEAVLRALYATAIKGNAYALKYIVERSGRAERDRRRQIQQSIDFWTLYIAEGREAIDEAERNGEELPSGLPHPEDVVIDYENGVRIAGPIDEAELEQLKEACRYRDVLIMQDALDRREASERLDAPGTALLFATILNHGVPDRFKLSDTEFVFRMLRYEGIPKRQLLKELYRGWRTLGRPYQRGKLFPPLQVGKERLELLFEVVQRFRDGHLNINGSPEELEAKITAIVLELQWANG